MWRNVDDYCFIRLTAWVFIIPRSFNLLYYTGIFSSSQLAHFFRNICSKNISAYMRPTFDDALVCLCLPQVESSVRYVLEVGWGSDHVLPVKAINAS